MYGTFASYMEKKVKAFISTNDQFFDGGDPEEIKLRSRERNWKISSVLIAAIAISSGLLGLIFSLSNILGLSDQIGRFGHLGTLLIVIFFPLMMLTAHAMDKGGAAEKALRLHRCRKQGLLEEEC